MSTRERTHTRENVSENARENARTREHMRERTHARQSGHAHRTRRTESSMDTTANHAQLHPNEGAERARAACARPRPPPLTLLALRRYGPAALRPALRQQIMHDIDAPKKKTKPFAVKFYGTHEVYGALRTPPGRHRACVPASPASPASRASRLTAFARHAVTRLPRARVSRGRQRVGGEG